MLWCCAGGVATVHVCATSVRPAQLVLLVCVTLYAWALRLPRWHSMPACRQASAGAHGTTRVLLELARIDAELLATRPAVASQSHTQRVTCCHCCSDCSLDQKQSMWERHTLELKPCVSAEGGSFEKHVCKESTYTGALHIKSRPQLQQSKRNAHLSRFSMPGWRSSPPSLHACGLVMTCH